jgi:hypothetical protein
MIRLYIPRWFYPQNLGDSIHSFFVPKVLKHLFPYEEIDVVTHGDLIPVMQKNPFVTYVREPSLDECTVKYHEWKALAFCKKGGKSLNNCLFAEWHPELWSTWNKHFDFFSEHPTINILTLNSLLQLDALHLAFTEDPSLFHTPYFNEPKSKERLNRLGIVPSTKLAGKKTPHPGCDGVGYRFNGDNGQSWKTLVAEIKHLRPEVNIVQFQGGEHDFGDYFPLTKHWPNLLKDLRNIDVAITTDGGIHHALNLVETPTVLLGSWPISKPEHLKTANSVYYKELHEGCLFRCKDNIRNLTGWPDLQKTCNLSCQKLDPVKLAQNVVRDFYS